MAAPAWHTVRRVVRQCTGNDHTQQGFNHSVKHVNGEAVEANNDIITDVLEDRPGVTHRAGQPIAARAPPSAASHTIGATQAPSASSPMTTAPEDPTGDPTGVAPTALVAPTPDTGIVTAAPTEEPASSEAEVTAFTTMLLRRRDMHRVQAGMLAREAAAIALKRKRLQVEMRLNDAALTAANALFSMATDGEEVLVDGMEEPEAPPEDPTAPTPNLGTGAHRGGLLGQFNDLTPSPLPAPLAPPVHGHPGATREDHDRDPGMAGGGSNGALLSNGDQDQEDEERQNDDAEPTGNGLGAAASRGRRPLAIYPRVRTAVMRVHPPSSEIHRFDTKKEAADSLSIARTTLARWPEHAPRYTKDGQQWIVWYEPAP